MEIITEPVSKKEIAAVAEIQFGNMVKAVVDVRREVLAVGGELHSDEEAALIEQGSRQEDIWGINLYPAKAADDWIEFDSMINIRPSQGNRSRGVENPAMRDKIKKIVGKLIA